MRKSGFQITDKVREILDRLEPYQGMKAMRNFQIDDAIFW
jgi:hypothetical protein